LGKRVAAYTVNFAQTDGANWVMVFWFKVDDVGTWTTPASFFFVKISISQSVSKIYLVTLPLHPNFRLLSLANAFQHTPYRL
jgi:hypothetical protein